jgi:hypothetical protein
VRQVDPPPDPPSVPSCTGRAGSGPSGDQSLDEVDESSGLRPHDQPARDDGIDVLRLHLVTGQHHLQTPGIEVRLDVEAVEVPDTAARRK